MDEAAHNKLVPVIWGIAVDVRRDLVVRGESRDALLLAEGSDDDDVDFDDREAK